MFARFIDRFRPTPPDESTRRAVQRSEEIMARVERQESEVQRHSAFARRVLRENELSPKIRAALRGSH